MSTLVNEVGATEAGFYTKRLRHLDAHFEQYVDDGRLPGFHLVVSRHGKVAHQHRYGMRDVEASLPIDADTIYRIYSMTKPVTSVALMMLVEEGSTAADRPGEQVHTIVWRSTRVAWWFGHQTTHRASRGANVGVAFAHAYCGSDVRILVSVAGG